MTESKRPSIFVPTVSEKINVIVFVATFLLGFAYFMKIEIQMHISC